MRTVISVLLVAVVCAFIVGCEGTATEPTCTKVREPVCSAKKLGPYKFTTDWMDEEGFITNWLIVGPFPNLGERPDNKGFHTDYLGGEADYTPAAGMKIAKEDGTKVKWTPNESPYAKVDFFSVDELGLDFGEEDVLAYCACWLKCEKDSDVEIRIGSDDGYKLWVNHKLIGEEHVYRGAETDQEVYPVKLTKGMNLILIKVDQDWGEFEFLLRVVTPDGKAASGIEVWN